MSVSVCLKRPASKCVCVYVSVLESQEREMNGKTKAARENRIPAWVEGGASLWVCGCMSLDTNARRHAEKQLNEIKSNVDI